jgi:rSAM/selenodomain-associated transferase 1
MRPPELVVFARAPVLGSVKTRLARDVGPERALAVYLDLATGVLRAVCEGPRSFAVTVAYTPDTDEARASIEQTFCQADRFEPQSSGDLGERMQRALSRALSRAPRAVVIGTDCPAVDRARVEQALAALDRVPCAIGPALDGGYYLLATTRADLPVFEQIAWSTDAVLSQTTARLRDARIPFETLSVERDVDTLEDLEAFSSRSASVE